jgi:DNA-binding NarL/FixJ family response regulator
MAGSSSSHQQPALMVGRRQERERLRTLLGRVVDGHGSLVLISGESGIGKSTLVADLVRQAEERGFLVLSGGCYDLSTTPPYGPWAEIFRGYPSLGDRPILLALIENPAGLGKIDSQQALFEEARRFFARLAAEQPLVIVLEDLHWSDPASLDALRQLARQADTLPALVVATFRTDEISPDHPLFRLLPLLVREAETARIELRSLVDDDVQALLRERYVLSAKSQSRLAAYLQSRAEGNPFYLTEVLRVLESEHLLILGDDGWIVGDLEQAPVPPLVRQVIEGRLSRLDQDIQRLLEVAAVIGQQVPFDIWRIVSEAGESGLATAVAQGIDAHLIVERPDLPTISFTHALVRETLYHRQAYSQRQQLHRHVAEILADRTEPALNDVAWHFARADDPRAIDWLVRAGERALALYAPSDAVSALSRAHAMAARSGRDLPLTAYRARASAHAIIGEFERARRDYEFVLDRARVTGDRASEWQALIDLGLLWAERDYERAGKYCRVALGLARALGDQQMIGHSLNRVANWHVNLDETDTALPLHREALAIFEERDDPEAIADTLDLLGMASYLGADLAASTAHYERAIAIYRDRDNRQRLAGCLAALTLNGGEMNSEIAAPVYRESAFWIGCGEEALNIAREIGWCAGEALASFTLSMATGVRGELGRALDNVETMLAISEQVEHRQWTIAARFTLGSIWMAHLDPANAAAEMERALAVARMSGSRFWIITAASGLAIVQTEAGDLDHAAATLGSVTQSSKPATSAGQRLCWFARAGLAIANSEAGRALAIIEQLERTSPRPSPDHSSPALMKLRGDALAGLGRFDEAERAYLAARDGAKLFEFRTQLWRIDAARGELYQALGRPEDARAAFESARATLDAIAETITDESLREQFQARAVVCLPADLAGGPSQPTAPLSPREQDVLRLLVDGKTDREIAAALFISPRTVMRHVTNILDKLDVPSRTAAATLAIRRDLV